MAVTINADTSNGLVMTPDTSGEIKLQSAGTDIATVNSSGITLATGKDLTLSSTALDASASGIYLGGTASANLLDDYETGDYTPSLTQGGTAMTVSGATGHYVKIGHLVWATWLITNITKSGSGDLRISLPFVVDGHGYGAAQANRMTFATNDRQLVWIALNNTSTAALYFNLTGDSNTTTVLASDLANSTAADVYGTVMYRTD